jgi:hypothetical protein
MSVSESRDALVKDVLEHMMSFHKRFNQDHVMETCTYSIYARGDVDDLFERFVKELEMCYGAEHGTETCTDRVKALYYIGKHLRGCILEINPSKTCTENKRWEMYSPVGREVIYIER